MSNIKNVKAREILDSRGNPTVEVDVFLEDGSVGQASVPSGASTGSKEAVELRDCSPNRFGGLGVLTAIDKIQHTILPEIIGHSAIDQEKLDTLLVDIDGTENKSLLGANSVLAVSLAVARAAAKSEGNSFYTYINQGKLKVLPVPMLNIINGGRHAENSTDFQEFMVVPSGLETFKQAIQAGSEVYQALKEILTAKGLGTTIGDEGGFAPNLSSNLEAIELVIKAIEAAGYRPGVDCFVAIDVAASELLNKNNGQYNLDREGSILSAEHLVEQYQEWINKYPIISIEDGMAEDDWVNWQAMTEKLGGLIQLVGDDLYATNTALIQTGIQQKSSNAVLIKPNQIGTLTETLKAIEMARASGWGTIVSHRSGETEDTTIADLAVATSAGQIKSGAPSRGERTAKYNRLLRIEEELGNRSIFAGSDVFKYLEKR